MSTQPNGPTDDDLLATVSRVATDGPFQPNWDTLAGYVAPRWYGDAKLGIFIHWGAYAVPAFGNEWYPRNMYRQGSAEFDHHVATYGPHHQFGYKDFIPQFTADRFDADAWVSTFRDAGAQFVVPVAEHHDGFAMYDTARSTWKATTMGPKRDIVGELAAAARRQWLVFGASSHRAEHWWFMNGGTEFPSDVTDAAVADFYGPAAAESAAPNEQFLQDWLLRTTELIDRYRPQLLWFDWWIEQPAFEPYLRTLAAYYYNRAAQWQQGVVINYKWNAFAPGSAVYDIERGAMGGIRPDVWQNDTSVSRTSWSHVADQQYKTLPEIIGELVDVVSKNGVLLLNIGPRADGTIGEPEQDLLSGLGRWLRVNGEAIYATRPWTVPGEGPTQPVVGSFTDSAAPAWTAQDFRFTTRSDSSGDYVYATALARPDDGVLRVRSWGRASGLPMGDPDRVEVLGVGPVPWERDDLGLSVTLPPGSAEGAVVVKLALPQERTSRRDDQFH